MQLMVYIGAFGFALIVFGIIRDALDGPVR